MLVVVATQKAQQRSVQAIFPLPRRIEPAATQVAPPDVDPASAAPRDQPTAITASTESSHLEPANSGPPAAAALPASSQATPTAANPPTRTSPAVSLADAITSESPQARAIQLKIQEAADRARVHLELANDDGPDPEPAQDDDDPERHPRLAPCTDIAGTAGEPGDD